MKKIITIVACVISCVSAFGATLCAKDGTYIGILRKSVDGNGSYNSAVDKKIWKVEFNYKTITGLAACNGISGTFGTANTTLNTSASDTGVYCWCKMEPVADTLLGTTAITGIASYWTFLQTYASSATCASTANTGCTAACSNAVANNSWATLGNNTGFRSKLFEAIW